MTLGRFSIRSVAIPLGILSLLTFGLLHAEPENDLGEVLTHFDEVQSDVMALSADFTMITESTLLKDEIVAHGRVFLTKPDAVRWEFSAPEEMRFVIADNTYTGYFPEQNRAETRDIQRWREHLFRFLGLGQASAELSQFYEISLGEGCDEEGTICLELEPKKQRVRKKMESVRFWIAEASYLPVKVEYRSKKGDRRTIEFTGMQVNPDLASNLYTVDLPEDVELSKGFSAFSGFSPTTQ